MMQSPSNLGTGFGSTFVATTPSAFTGSTLSFTNSNTPFAPKPLETVEDKKDANDQKAMEVRGLNISFLNYITKCVKENCFVDLSKVNLEYNSYLTKIGQNSDNMDLGPLPESTQKLPLSVNFGSKIPSADIPKLGLSNNTPVGFQTLKAPDLVSAFGSSNATETPKFNFTSGAKTTETPKFDFSSNAKTTETPKFDFTSGAKTTETPKFDFSSNAKTTETPKFDFSSNPKTTETPKFNFTSGDKPADPPKFDFTGGAKTTETPKFDFTNSKAPVFGVSTPNKATEAANSPFGFSNQKPSIFSPAPATSFGTNAPAAGLAGSIGFTSTREENVEGEDDEVPHEEQVGDALMAGKAGEEGEVTLYSVRSKLRKFVNSAWELIGVGLLKVNQNQATKSSRIILRSESGKVLFNVSIFAGMPVDLKDTSVNFSASLTPGSLTSISAKVKQKQDATALVDAIQKAKPKS
jgi:nucleoporin NUP2